MSIKQRQEVPNVKEVIKQISSLQKFNCEIMFIAIKNVKFIYRCIINIQTTIMHMLIVNGQLTNLQQSLK